MLELRQFEIDGEQYMTVYLYGEPMQTYRLSRKATQEELDWMLESCMKRFSEAIENRLLYGKEEQNGN